MKYMKGINLIRIIFIIILSIILLFWSSGIFAKAGLAGLLTHTMFGVFTFIMLVVNCIAGVLSLQGDDHKVLTNRMTWFTLSIYITIPLLVVVGTHLIENDIDIGDLWTM